MTVLHQRTDEQASTPSKTKYKRAVARMRPTDSPEEARYGYLLEIKSTPYLVTPFKNQRQRDRFERAVVGDYPHCSDFALAAAITLAFAGEDPADRRAGLELLEKVLSDYCDRYGDPLEYEGMAHQDLTQEILKSCTPQ
ncbi:hypothetical protein [Candidatus Laterigemmans baculatus]|uniref:hypothetical protein n=1 Tax=Candidatus Laterigemmans baculatus TaxID=2770505 RepID=UPI0013D9B5FF|nr:hypothetical protein [Candidatus Laterigemmans baculatus]